MNSSIVGADLYAEIERLRKALAEALARIVELEAK